MQSTAAYLNISTATVVPVPTSSNGKRKNQPNARYLDNLPVITPRALQELLKRNHKNTVSVKADNQILLSVHRPVAMHFSSVWRRELSDPRCNIVTVNFPADPPAAPVVNQPAPASGNETATAVIIPPPPPHPSNRDALKFVVQWMEAGGAVPKGQNAVPYPIGYRTGLEKLLAFASMLEVSELVARLKRELGRMPAAKPKKCPACKKFEHPGKECQSCFHCGDYRHRIRECPVRHQAFLEREARRARKAEYASQREVAHQRWLEKEERRRKGEEKRGIAAGELGVNDAGKTIPVRGPGRLTFGRALSDP